MQHKQGEANNCSPSQEILDILQNPKVHYHIHNSRLFVSILKWIQSKLSQPVSLKTILILSYLRSGLQSGVFTSGPPNIFSAPYKSLALAILFFYILLKESIK